MNKQQIECVIANAPENATHFDGKTYFRFEMYEHGQAYLVLKNGVWDRGLPAYPVFGCQSLTDLKTILELMERVERLESLVKIAYEEGFYDYELHAKHEFLWPKSNSKFELGEILGDEK